ncbi:MAG: sugar phosphate nucleotidyltransferase [bacterium]|nr:sugar phosphate nucleotidyltransferase [bacterium]
MKGVILAAGKGTRLLPVTKVVNKSLVLVYDKPLIYYPITTLRDSGITEILIIARPGHGGQFLDLLGSGKDLGVRLTYDVQEEPLGIAHGLAIAEDFTDEGKFAFILADNIFEDTFEDVVRKFSSSGPGAVIAVKKVGDPWRSGVVEIKDGTVISIEEKPKNPKSSLVATGFYLYDNNVFEIIRTLKPSERGEYEITDVNKAYLANGQLSTIEIKGTWIDAGTFDSLLEANIHIANKVKAGRK